MPVEVTPLFRPEIVRPRLATFDIRAIAAAARDRLRRWVDLLDSPSGMEQKETELLPDFLTDVFRAILGYRGPVQRADGRYTISREALIEAYGKFADAALGYFDEAGRRIIVAVEGKGPKDPLDLPYAGRRMSAVDQAYRYAINAPCDWLIVTNLREIRLYHKGSTQRTFERFAVSDLARRPHELKRFVYFLGADRVVPDEGQSHLYDLLTASEQAGERLTQEFYRTYSGIRHDLFSALVDTNPDVSSDDVLGAAQRLLDRALFIAFAEDRSLLPADTLARAYGHRDPYNPRPIWENFQGLFRAINDGAPTLKIPQYNGGLFDEHRLLDSELVVPDAACEGLKRLGDYNYGTADHSGENGDGQLVDVEILGHIFEQSIEHLEAMRTRIAEGGKATRATSRRKREGAFYTPSYVTRYIVSRTLRPTLDERFERLRAKCHGEAAGTAGAVLRDPRVYHIETLNNPQRDALVAFWEAWIEEVKTIRVVDPACGSGAFLIEVFDQLLLEYQQAVDRLTELRRGEFAGSFFDPDRTILRHNIYGVDLNPEAIEIARLSIWIKTAQRGKILTDLDHNIRVGNSIVRDPTVDRRAFNWSKAFPEVFEHGGFDAAVGNPPYVRAEMLAFIKPYLQENYTTYAGTADLYVYFYELGIRLLRPGGRMSYVVTNKWLKTGYARALRRYFTEATWVEEIVDLGHAREVFPDADVFPCILRARKPDETEPPRTLTACVIPRDELDISDLGAQVRTRGFEYPRAELGAGQWTLEPPALATLFRKVRDAGQPLRAYLEADPKYGIKTGFNEAYLLSSREHRALVAASPDSARILQPFLRGQDIKRWLPRWAERWMIVMKSSSDHAWPWAASEDEEAAEAVFLQTYPALHAYLKRYEDRLRARTDQGRFWWELRSCDYYELFKRPKIIHTDIMWRAEFAYVDEPMYLVNTAYMWPTTDLYILGVVNSPLMWSYMWRHAQHGKDEALRIIYSFVQTLPIAETDAETRAAIASGVRGLIGITRARATAVRRLHDWLRVEFGITKPGQKLAEPHMLDSDEFVGEVKKRRRGRPGVPSAELQRLRDEYRAVVGPMREDAQRAFALEREIGDLVNAAYGLTNEEVDLLWRTAPPRMPESGRPDFTTPAAEAA